MARCCSWGYTVIMLAPAWISYPRIIFTQRSLSCSYCYMLSVSVSDVTTFIFFTCSNFPKHSFWRSASGIFRKEDCQSETEQIILDLLTCVVQRTWNPYGDRCFAAARPRVLNSLLPELWQCDSQTIQMHLKAYFWGGYGTMALCDF